MVVCSMYSTCGTPAPNSVPPLEGSAAFATTHWGVVLTAGQQEPPQATAALEQLCRA